MGKIQLLERSISSTLGRDELGRVASWSREARDRPAPWVAVMVAVATATLVAVLWRFGAVQEWLVPSVHLVDRVASVVSTGFLVLPLLVWRTEGADLALAKARRLWDVGILATCAWLLTTVAHLLAHYSETGRPASLSGFFTWLGEEWEAQLLGLQAALLGSAILAAVVGDFGRDLGRRSEPRVLVVGLGLAALGAGALSPSAELSGSTRLLLVAHVLAAVVWVSSLAALALLAGVMRRQLDELGRVAQNFSQMALVCATTVLVTGAGMALSGLGSQWPSFRRGVGVLLVLKFLAFCVLVAAGHVQRKNVRSLRPDRRRLGRLDPFIRWAVAELVIMAATLALSVGATEMAELVSGS